MKNSYPFSLPSLPYCYDALQPYINEKTMKIHHDTLFQGYMTRLNNALKEYPRFQNWSLERLLMENYKLPKNIQTTVYNNAGGIYNHTMYFASMTPRYQNPSRYVQRILEQNFGSLGNFRQQMLESGLSVFGSGWAWLVKNRRDRLEIITTKNQDTPLSQGFDPILPLDVWEHAYFLQYLAARNTYIENWFHVIDWEYVEHQLRRLF